MGRGSEKGKWKLLPDPLRLIMIPNTDPNEINETKVEFITDDKMDWDGMTVVRIK